MTIRLNVVDRNGEVHDLETSTGGSLMETLREYEWGVAAICGGMCSCATCHVYIAPEWAARLPDRQSDESDLLAELQFKQETSRLSCQVRLDAALDGLSVKLAPEE
jgi:ferredoxin, 2Fe-2S